MTDTMTHTDHTDHTDDTGYTDHMDHPDHSGTAEHQDPVDLNQVGMEAYQQAQADGLDPQQTFDAVASAIGDAAAEAGIPAEAVEAGLQAAGEAFQQAMNDGADPDAAFQAAMEAGEAAGNAYAEEHGVGTDSVSAEPEMGIEDDDTAAGHTQNTGEGTETPESPNAEGGTDIANSNPQNGQTEPVPTNDTDPDLGSMLDAALGCDGSCEEEGTPPTPAEDFVDQEIAQQNAEECPGDCPEEYYPDPDECDGSCEGNPEHEPGMEMDMA